MRRLAIRLVVGVTLVAGHVPGFATAQQQRPEMVFDGAATALQSDSPLYRERHRISGQCVDGYWRPDQHRVDYLRPGSDEIFARKRLEFPGLLARPGVDFRQPAFDERLQVSVGRTTVDILWSKGSQTSQWNLEATDNLVIDAGFNHFIRQHWSTLGAGDAVGFRFLAPTRGDAFGFVAEPDPDPLPGADRGFRIRPAGLLLRLAVDPIRLGYRDDGFLTHYRGLGNIRRNEDENYQVAITYTLRSAPPCPLVRSS